MFGSGGGTRLTITNSTISHSQTYSIRAASGNAVLTESDNTYISNASGDILLNQQSGQVKKPFGIYVILFNQVFYLVN